MRVAFALITVLLAALLASAAPARAAGPEVGIADDRVLLNGGQDAERAVAEWREQAPRGGAVPRGGR